MMREVASAIMAGFVGVLLLWFMLPLLNTAYENVKMNIDVNNPTNQAMLTIGDGIYLMLPFIVFIVVGYLIFAYATRALPTDF